MSLDDKLENILELIKQRDEINGQLLALLGEDVESKKKGGRPRKEEAASRSKVGRSMPKPCCGSTGTRHFKTCTQASLVTNENNNSGDQLSKTVFLSIKWARNDRDFSSREFAEANDIPLGEVNKACKAQDYREYLTL